MRTSTTSNIYSRFEAFSIAIGLGAHVRSTECGFQANFLAEVQTSLYLNTRLIFQKNNFGGIFASVKKLENFRVGIKNLLSCVELLVGLGLILFCYFQKRFYVCVCVPLAGSSAIKGKLHSNFQKSSRVSKRVHQ